MIKQILIIILLIIGLFFISGCNSNNFCDSDNQCPNGECAIVQFCDEMDIFCSEIQQCIKDEWQCHLCSGQNTQSNYYDLCCDNLS